MRYFTAFTRSEREGTADSCGQRQQNRLAALLRGAIAQLGLRALAYFQDEVRSLSALLASELIVALPEPGADRQRHLDSLLEGLASVEVDHVLLPAALAPETNCGTLCGGATPTSSSSGLRNKVELTGTGALCGASSR